MPPKHDDISSEEDDAQQHIQADEDMEVSDQESIVSNANANGGDNDQDMEEGGAQTD